MSRVGQIGVRISVLLLLAWKPWVMRTNSIQFSDAWKKVKMSTILTSQGRMRIKTGTAHSRVPGFCDAHRAREDYILQVLCQRHRVAVSMLGRFSHIRLFAIPWIVARQVLLSMGFSRQEHWGGLPCSPPGDLPDPGIEPVSLTSPALAGEFFTTSATKGPLVPISI